MMKRSMLFSGAAALAVAGMFTSSAMAAHIDRFNDGEFNLEVNSVGETDSVDQSNLDENTPPSVLGGSRDSVLTFESSDEAGVTQITAAVNPDATTPADVPEGTLNLNSTQGEDGLLEVTYGFDGAGGLIDLVQPADVTYDGFSLNVLGANNAEEDQNATVSIAATDSGGNSDQVDRNLPDGFTGALEIPFSEFDGNVNLSTADSLTLTIDGTDSGDYTFSNFRRTVGEQAQVIPSPAALPAGMLMLGGLLLNRRRRKQA